MPLIVIWTTVHYESYSMLCGLLWMWARSILSLGRILDMRLHDVLFALRNWRDRQPWHHMYRLSSSSPPFIKTWNQLNGQTLAGKSAHRKFEWINRVRDYWIDKLIGQWSSTDHIEEAKKLWDYNSKFAREIHWRHWHLSYIDCIDWQNAPNQQLRTL